MRDSQNKTELFCFLADTIADTDTVHPIVVTKEELEALEALAKFVVINVCRMTKPALLLLLQERMM